MDTTKFTVVCLCSCGWRSLDSTRSGAWKSAARHLKWDHADLMAARRAQDAAAACDRRKRRQLPDDIGHGNLRQAPHGRAATGPGRRTAGGGKSVGGH